MLIFRSDSSQSDFAAFRRRATERGLRSLKWLLSSFEFLTLSPEKDVGHDQYREREPDALSLWERVGVRAKNNPKPHEKSYYLDQFNVTF